MDEIGIDLGSLIREEWKNTLEKTIYAEGTAEKSNGKIHSDRPSGWSRLLSGITAWGLPFQLYVFI